MSSETIADALMAPCALGLAPRGEARGLHSFAICARLVHQAAFRPIERVDLGGCRSAARARKRIGEGAPVGHGAASASWDAISSRGEARR